MLCGCPGQYLTLQLEVLSLLFELPDVEAEPGAVLWFLVIVPSFPYLNINLNMEHLSVNFLPNIAICRTWPTVPFGLLSQLA